MKYNMRKKLVTIIALFLICCGIQAQDMESKTYYFPLNGYSFNHEMLVDLDDFIQKIDTIEHIEIYGFCDSTGSLSINEKLSKKRANSARNQLIKRGIHASKISVKGLGETSPISEKIPNYKFDHNRKVEIVCYVKWDPENDAKKVFNKLEDKGQEFTIRNQADTALTTDKGTMLVFAKNTFVTQSDRPIKIIVSEYFNKSELVAYNLTTVGEKKNQLLHLGNMIKVIAVQGEDTLGADLNFPIQISIKAEKPSENVKPFYGIKEANGFVKWYPETKSGGIKIGDGPASKGQLPGVISPMDTLSNPKSKVCDSLRQIEDEALIAKFSFFQKIFMPKSKKEAIIADLASQKANRDSCEVCYNAYKSQEMAKKQRRMKMKNIVKTEKERYQIAMLEKDTAKVAPPSLDQFSYYVFNVTRPGLFNVDKYINFSQPRIDIIVRDCNTSINAKLVFNDEMAMLPSKKTKDGFIFRDVPQGVNVTLFAVQYRDEKVGFYNQSFKTDSREMRFYMNFEETTIEKVKMEFLKLDDPNVRKVK